MHHFSEKGGSGHKGESSHSTEPRLMVFKRLHHEYGQEDAEFWKQIMMLSCYRHENLISLLGFCNMKKEKILVFDYASNKSLDLYLSNTGLTWTQRLKICVGAARGLNYLHDPEDTKRRLVHGDMKSSNIMLDENWTAKVSDFGLQTYMALDGNIERTSSSNMFYSTSEADDVYNFGVVLVEVVCGGAKKNLVRKWQDRYENSKLDEIIIHELRLQMGEDCLHKFASIASKCLKSKCPTMAEVVKELEDALKLQERYEDEEKKMEEEELKKIAKNIQFHGSQEELLKLLSEGTLLLKDRTWFSLDNNKEHCEMISAARNYFHSMTCRHRDDPRYKFKSNVVVHAECTTLSADIEFQFLSPHIPYAVYVVFKSRVEGKMSLEDGSSLFKCWVKGRQLLTSNLSVERKDGWLMIELCQFSSRSRRHYIPRFKLEASTWDDEYLIAGLECRPLERGRLKVCQDLADTYCDQKIPSDYIRIFNKSNNEVIKTEDLYLLLRKGFYKDDISNMWLFIDRNGKKCHMIGAREVLDHEEWERLSLKELRPFIQDENASNRFDEAARINSGRRRVNIECRIKPKFLSPHTKYVAYLVFKLIPEEDMFSDPVKVKHTHFTRYWVAMDVDDDIIFFECPQTSIISQQVGQKDYNPINRPKMNGIPKPRKDGWMEVKLWEFQSVDTQEIIKRGAKLSTFGYSTLPDLLVQGIEHRPI